MNVIKKTKQTINFTAPLIILAIIFIIQSSILIKEHYNNKIYLEELKNRIILATMLSKLIHSTQIERGLSVGYVSETTNNNNQFKKHIYIQRLQTDKYIKKISLFYQKNKIGDYPYIKNELETTIINGYESLKKIRSLIDSYNLTASQILSFYSTFNSNILKIITDITKTSNLSHITQDLISYINFLYSKEYNGIERALGTEIIIKHLTDINTINKFNSISTTQKVYKNIFLRYANKTFYSYYYNIVSSKIVHKIKMMKKIILSANLKLLKNLDAKEWFNFTTKMINKLKKLDEKLSANMILNINKELKATQNNLITILLISAISIILFLSLAFIIYIFLKNENKLRELIDKYIIYSTTDTNGKIIEVSKAFVDISGYEENELLGKNHNIIRHPDMPKIVFKDLWTTIKSGKTWHGTVKNLKKNGDYYWVKANIEPIRNLRGKIIAYMAIRQDITDKIKVDHLNKTLKDRIKKEVQKNREKDQQMLQQSRLAQMGEMISMIAHQWRQPLTAISATSQSIMLKAKLNKLDKDTAIELSNNISKYSQHLSSTIDDFREFFKTNKKKQDINYSSIVESVLNIVMPAINNQNIKIVTKLKSSITFNTYPNELKQVVLNLIKNAEDALLEKEINNPTITIISEENRLIVKDNAGGIPKNIIDKIFDPYFSTKTKKDGTGLGLYMSKTIIEEHCKGKLTVANDEEGAVFTIELPPK